MNGLMTVIQSMGACSAAYSKRPASGRLATWSGVLILALVLGGCSAEIVQSDTDRESELGFSLTPYASATAAGVPTAGDCCTPWPTPGCADSAVEDCVCGHSPACCERAWDQPCVGLAILCNGCAGIGETQAVAALLGDSDGDGVSDLDELLVGADPFRPDISRSLEDLDGDGLLNYEDGDIDGDGIDNARDADVDGDGTKNGEDDDVDGDGTPNAQDHDVDGDGEDNEVDEDDDGDGKPDTDDEDADGDGQKDPDCENGSVLFGSCICDKGWRGDSCDEPICEVRNNCNGHGKCIKPETCECNPDWSGGSCLVPTCVLSPSYCNDGVLCTLDECDPSSGCKYSPLCSSTQICEAGFCLPKTCNNTTDCESRQSCRDGLCNDEGCFTDSECADGNPCTTDRCSITADCEHEPVLCPAAATCVRGRCIVDCRDSIPRCPTGTKCREGGCVQTCDPDDEDSGCDDGGWCSGDGECLSQSCQTNDDCDGGADCEDGVCAGVELP